MAVKFDLVLGYEGVGWSLGAWPQSVLPAIVSGICGTEVCQPCTLRSQSSLRDRAGISSAISVARLHGHGEEASLTCKPLSVPVYRDLGRISKGGGSAVGPIQRLFRYVVSGTGWRELHLSIARNAAPHFTNSSLFGESYSVRSSETVRQ